MTADVPVIDPARTPVPDWRGLVLRYGGAVLAVAAAAGLRWLVHDVLGGTLAYITFHPLVALVAMLAGGGPGVLATVLSGVVVDVWVIAPDGHHDAAEAVGMVFFAASGFVMSTMGEMLRRTRRREKAGLEDQVAARTDDLQRANASLQNEVEDRRRAEQSLRGSERRFRTVFEHAATGIAITSLDVVFERCNPAYCALLGYTEEEFREVVFASLVYAEDREANLAEIRRLTAGEVSFFEVENRYVHKSGRPVWVRKWVSLLPDEAGKPAHILALVTDMTERRRAELELRREHESSEAIINTAPVIVLVLGPNGRILRFNSFMERLTGWTLAEARGRDWFDTFLPARDRERIRGLFGQALGNERTHANVNPIVTRAGVEREIEWYDAPVRGADGELTGLLCIGKDITARKQAEEALRASERRWRDLAEALPQLVWTCTPDGECDFLSRQWVDFTGRAEAGQLGYGWLDQVHPDDRDRLKSVWAEAVAAGKVFDIEFRIRRADGTYRWFKTRAVPVRGADGRVAKWFGSNTDIEDLRRATDELRASEERLHLMADALPVLIAYIGADGRYRFNNAAYQHWFGLPAGAYQGRHMREVLGEAAYTVLQEHAEAALAGRPCQFEARVPYHGAGPRDVLVHYVPHRDQDGRVVGFFALIIDLTERKQAEEALRASEELQRAVLASISSHVAVLGRDGQIVAVNPAWEEFARENGGDPGRCGVGVNYLAVCRAAAGEGGEETHRVADGIQALLDGTAGAFSVEYPCPFDTRPRWFLLQATPLRVAGGGVVVSHMDITGRVLAERGVRDREARLRAILDTAADGIITIDGGGVIQSVNPAAERMFGYATAEMAGRNVSMLMPPPHREEHDGYLARYRRTGEARVIGVGREVEGRRKDGTVFPVELAVSEVPHLPLFTGIVHDITRRKELERDVVEIVSLEQRRIGQDLHDSVAQELTALSLLADDLAETLRTDPTGGAGLVRRIARGLQCSQHQLRAVLRGLLPVAVDAGGLMAALSDLADRTGREGPAACVFDCPEPIAVADNVVATQVYLIAQEAVRNAVKHGRPRAVRITLEADHHLTLRVRDDGIGMPARPTEIQGLGLRIMRNRAAIIGAVLTIGPAEPTGTVVTCVLARKWHEHHPTR